LGADMREFNEVSVRLFAVVAWLPDQKDKRKEQRSNLFF
jgi:hypothetical protein